MGKQQTDEIRMHVWPEDEASVHPKLVSTYQL
jgi:hypothetical protein